jgi:hypothetical protein
VDLISIRVTTIRRKIEVTMETIPRELSRHFRRLPSHRSAVANECLPCNGISEDIQCYRFTLSLLLDYKLLIMLIASV